MYWTKLIHVSCVALSYSLFVLRGVWMLRDSAMLRRGWVRIVPHVIDTLLLASAILLCLQLRLYPGADPWLTAKVLALGVYIALGTVALRRGRSKRTRLGAWLAAQGVYFYMVAAALTHSPLPLG
jgi:uncharacterized membrane protein SirB2